MTRIHKLPESLIQKIAAGEVVERPASVLKELAENSLDAGSNRIHINIDKTGQSLLRISDDGVGMTKEEARLAIQRHATSKISSLEDLEHIETFGFRGEALPSIAAVSRFSLTTRPKGTEQAWNMTAEGGLHWSEKPIGAPKGTTVEVKDLFFNTPARKKFMKKESTEKSHIFRTCEDLALTSIDVAWNVSSEGRKALTLPAYEDGEEGLAKRINDLWGESTRKLLPVLRQGAQCSIKGFVSSLEGHLPTARWQKLFINGRPVSHRQIHYAVYDALRESLHGGLHPIYVLFITIDPTLIDVNVHPTKREVKLSHDNEVFGFVRSAVKDAAHQISVAAGLQFTDKPIISQDRPFIPNNIFREKTSNYVSKSHILPIPVGSTRTTQTFTAPAEHSMDNSDGFKTQDYQFLGQTGKTYLLAHSGKEILIIDQHAAAERVLFEKLISEKGGSIQKLLIPVNWEVSPAEQTIISDNTKELKDLRFELESFGSSTFRLTGIPAFLTKLKDIQTFLGLLLEALTEGHSLSRDPLEKVATAACKAAVKAGDKLSHEELDGLLKDLKKCQFPFTCPHGRPTMLRLPFTELARRFRRT